jgi:hypothetical protein
MSSASNDEVVVELKRIGDRIERLEESNIAGHAMNASATRESGKVDAGAAAKGQHGPEHQEA